MNTQTLNMHKVIIGAVIVLITLIIGTTLASSLHKNSAIKTAPTPTLINRQGKPRLTPMVDDEVPLSDQERTTLSNLSGKFPVVLDDLEMAYSPSSNFIFVYKKTANADRAFQNFIDTNNLSSLTKKRDYLFINVTHSPVAIVNQFEDLIKEENQFKNEGKTKEANETSSKINRFLYSVAKK